MRIERITEIDENLIKQIMSVWEAISKTDAYFSYGCRYSGL